jgi:uncharacterized protein (TIGR02996 family)
MHTEAAFLKAITDDPESDAPRLVYADWLDEHDQPERAEFIRLQCALAGMPAAHRDRPRTEARARELLAAHEKTWLGPLRGLLLEWHFWRGFVAGAVVDLRAFVRKSAAIFRRAPLEAVQFRRAEGGSGYKEELIGRLASSPCLGRLREVDFAWISLGEEGVRALLASPHLGRVRSLAFGEGDSSVATARALAECPNLPRLSELTFAEDSPESQLGDEGVRVLASARSLAGLTALRLLNNGIGPAGAAALAASPHLTRLTSLYLGEGSYDPNQVGDEGLSALAASPNLAGLTQLSLPMNDVGDTGVQALARSPYLRRLEALDLRHNAIGTAGVVALAGSANLDSVTFLDLRGSHGGDEGLQALASSPHAANLTYLLLIDAQVGLPGVQAFIDSPHLQRLQRLWLGVSMTEKQRQTLRNRFGDRFRESR